MTNILTNKEKLSIIAQHAKNLELAGYNAYLDLIQANAISASEEIVAQINLRINEIELKKSILESEKESLL